VGQNMAQTGQQSFCDYKNFITKTTNTIIFIPHTEIFSSPILLDTSEVFVTKIVNNMSKL